MISCFRMKKALRQEEEKVTPRWGTGVQLRSTGGSPWQGGEQRAKSEVFGPTVKEEVEQAASNGSTTPSSGGMVTVSPSGVPKARISMSSMDRGREDYISQFSERVCRTALSQLGRYLLIICRLDRYQRRLQSKQSWRASITMGA